jgi:putative ATP-binding cassette transporter
MGLLSGFSSFLFINFINKIVGFIIAGNFTADKRAKYALLMASVILMFVFVRRLLSLAIIRISQTIFWDLRRKILASVLQASYSRFNRKKIEIQAAVVSDVNSLTLLSQSIIGFITSLILAVVTFIYLATISFPLFLVTLPVSVCGCVVYYFGGKRNRKRFMQARELENSFLAYMRDIMDGFKEVYMEPRKGRAILDERINRVAEEAHRNNVEAFTGSLNNQITGQVLFYTLISLILLFLGQLIGINAKDTVSYVFTLLYLLGALETIMVLIPALIRAKVASNRLINLQTDLRVREGRNRGMPAKYISKEEFSGITIANLEYSYQDEGEGQTFSIGPLHFGVRRGEVAFICGGNGSGKTTFINTLAGLVEPSAGEIRLNGEIVTTDSYPVYRTAFSVVFSDFYLFTELVGVPQPDPVKWAYYLELFELTEKVSLQGGRFSTINLSVGQRKRLALIICLMENKPILVLDEWAADQDPFFRRKFYIEILPLLKLEGFTIIAITHDDRYYHCADRLYKMNYGQLTEVVIDSRPALY